MLKEKISKAKGWKIDVTDIDFIFYYYIGTYKCIYNFLLHIFAHCIMYQMKYFMVNAIEKKQIILLLLEWIDVGK